jgi:hypothetical protein
MAQALAFEVIAGLLYVPLMRSARLPATTSGYWLAWAVASDVVVWYAAAQLGLVWRAGSGRVATRPAASLLLVGVLALELAQRPRRFWYPIDRSSGRIESIFHQRRDHVGLTPEHVLIGIGRKSDRVEMDGPTRRAADLLQLSRQQLRLDLQGIPGQPERRTCFCLGAQRHVTPRMLRAWLDEAAIGTGSPGPSKRRTLLLAR